MLMLIRCVFTNICVQSNTCLHTNANGMSHTLQHVKSMFCIQLSAWGLNGCNNTSAHCQVLTCVGLGVKLYAFYLAGTFKIMRGTHWTWNVWELWRDAKVNALWTQCICSFDRRYYLCLILNILVDFQLIDSDFTFLATSHFWATSKFARIQSVWNQTRTKSNLHTIREQKKFFEMTRHFEITINLHTNQMLQCARVANRLSHHSWRHEHAIVIMMIIVMIPESARTQYEMSLFQCTSFTLPSNNKLAYTILCSNNVCGLLQMGMRWI